MANQLLSIQQETSRVVDILQTTKVLKSSYLTEEFFLSLFNNINKEDIMRGDAIGCIHKLENGSFDAGPWITADPIKNFDNPHDAENYLREVCGVHPVIKTACYPLNQDNGERWPLGAVVVCIETEAKQ
jgi:hypothetical protein